MTPAAFRAVYSDWKLVRTRGVVQLVFEVPIEESDAAYQAVGGMPDPAKSVWCAVARIEEPKEAPTQETITKPHTDKNSLVIETTLGELPAAPVDKEPRERPEPTPHFGKSYAKRIGILCGERAFQLFLYGEGHQVSPDDKEAAAGAVRKFCGVESRREIREGTKAGNRWLILQSGYRAWMDGPRAGVA